MRPRPEGRGEPQEQTGRLGGGGGFNAATTRRPWRTLLRGVGHADRRVASMRPRPEGRGERRASPSRSAARRRSFNAATTRRPWRTRPTPAARDGKSGASMRPRPEGRGERSAGRTSRRRARRLQCGHDPKAVENHRKGKRAGRAVGASMRPRPEGRGELPAASASAPTWRGFNAATTRRPWRTVDPMLLSGEFC